MTTATRPTKQAIMALARRKFGRKVQLELRTYKDACSAEERAERYRQSKELGEQIESHKQQRSLWPADSAIHSALRTAARFVVDVNGDEPSIPQLSTALAAAESVSEWAETLREMQDRRKAITAGAHCKRYSLSRLGGVGGLQFWHQVADGDTLEELYDKLASEVA